MQPIVENFVDQFLPLPDPKSVGKTPGKIRLIHEQILNRSFMYIIADIHCFYGGLFSFGSLLTALQANRKFIYEGYYLGRDLAPARPYPKDFEIIPQITNATKLCPGNEISHILKHNEYYISNVVSQCGVSIASGEKWKPDLSFIGSGTEECRHFGLDPGGFVGWQPSSNNRRKDYPLSHWNETIRAFPDQLFVAFTQSKETLDSETLDLPNVRIIKGSLPVIMRLIKETRLFIGIDSGLSHIAVAMGKPTVCVCPNSHWGYFFPYPRGDGYENLHTVSHPGYIQCRGCFMTCQHEFLTSTFSRGALCLRTIPPSAVINAITEVL